MKTIAILFASCWFVSAALADDSCAVQATGKSLHGAALTSFAKKCCKDQAAAQKLHGAAQTSFTKKCLSDATGSQAFCYNRVLRSRSLHRRIASMKPALLIASGVLLAAFAPALISAPAQAKTMKECAAQWQEVEKSGQTCGMKNCDFST